MRPKLILLISVIAISAISCKKSKHKNGQEEPEKKVVVRTFAGEGSPAFLNGPSLSAKFHFPEDAYAAPDGSIYVTDVLNFSIRRIVSGQVITYAGGNGFDILNGNIGIAKFKNPFSITSDANGNFYTTDENDPRIRKITPAGEVSTYAGTATLGFANGNADTARFFPGNYIISDPQGNVFVSDSRFNCIRKVSAAGQVTTVAGTMVPGFNNGNAETAQFSIPYGITIDKQGNLYVADFNNFRIRKITPAGIVSTLAGSGVQGDKDGSAAEAQFNDMRDLAIDGNGNLYLSDANSIRKITPNGVVSTIAGSTKGFHDGDGAQALFDYPNGLSLDAEGNIYVADLSNNRVRKISFE